MTNDTKSVLSTLQQKFYEETITAQETKDAIPTLWVERESLRGVLNHLKGDEAAGYDLLYDLTAIDERERLHRDGQPEGDFSVVYHLMSLRRNEDIRLKVPLKEGRLSVPSILDIWPNANWYEREVWDMFGIEFERHPHLRRILMPDAWEGHPLRKDHHARATEAGPLEWSERWQEEQQDNLQFRPEDWGMEPAGPDTEFMFLNLGPQHPGTHGVLRVVLQLDGEEIVDAVPDIGFHHRGAEKMGERQSWHTYIPYTDRIDYLGGVMNNFPYVMAVEKLAGIEIPERAQVIRVMMAELFRISSHLVWYGTFAQDVGQLSPVFYMFTDREKVFDIVEAVTGGRMHPSWFRIGGTTMDLPEGWEELVKYFLDYFPARLDEYDKMVMKNRIFKKRTIGVGDYTLNEALEWGVTGPGLRATGMEWDYRKKRPYSSYDQFDFDIPTQENGDCYARAQVRIEEMRQSARIIRQCLENMPAGPYKADHPLTTPPRKDKTMYDIETLIHHFLSVSWGPVIPAGEAIATVEASKGLNGYYLVSDGNHHSYRTRIRAPSFPHIQMVPYISRGQMVPDLLAILGSVDFVLADVDR